MATFYQGSPVVDPDFLAYTIAATDIATNFAAASNPILIDTTNRRIALKVVGTMDTDGATIKAVYSKLKEAWRTDAELIKFPFPMGPITDEQFEMINGWNWDKVQTSGDASATTVELLRTGGWSVVNGSGNITEQWTGAISLGTLVNNTDQIYYQQVDSAQASVDFVLTGPVNQAIQVVDDPNGDGNYVDGFDRRTYLKLFVREYNKLYAQSTITDIGVSTLTFQAYRFPLSNADDLNINGTDVQVAGVATSAGTSSGTTATVDTAVNHELTNGDVVNVAGVTPAGYNGTYTVTVSDANTITYTTAGSDIGPITVQGTVRLAVYDNINITYLRDSNDALYNILGTVSDTTYAIGDVVQEDNGAGSRWFECTVAGTVTGSTSVAQSSWGGTATFVAYTGERQVGTNYYAFQTIVDADTTVAATASGAARTADIYTAIQYYLRQNSDIDASNPGTITGKTADPLLRFVGSQLLTSTGVYIDSFNVSDTNAIDFYDYSGTLRQFPFVATLTINFGTNLQNDANAKYWVFFTNDDAGDNAGADFGTTNAIVVNDNDSNPMTGDVSAASSVARSYNYDGNVQRGAASAGIDAPVTVVGIGLSTGQYVTATGTIARSIQNSVSLVAALERNYSNPA